MPKSHNGVPLHVQIEEEVIQKIESGEWKSNTLLPIETDLAKVWGVHRLTLRAAFTSLEQRGYIHRIQGKGTFVRDIGDTNRQYLPLDKLRSSREKMEQAKGSMKTQVLTFREIPVPSEIAPILKVENDTPIFYIERLRSYQDIPTVYEKTYILKHLVEGITPAALEYSKFDFIASKGLNLDKSERTFRGVIPSREISEFLNIPHLSIVMHMESVTSLDDGTILELVYSYYNQDIYKFSVTAHK